MRKSRLNLCFLLALTILQASCVRKDEALSVETIVRYANEYEFKVVTVKGCFRAGLETREILPCAPVSNFEDWIWIDDVRSEEAFEKIPAIREGDKYRRRTGKEHLTDAEQKKYDELLGLQTPIPAPVVIRGEFQSSTEKQFGHLGAFKYRIILYKVLKIG